MKQKVMMKKIIAISMACMMVFLSAGMHIVTAKAEEKKENVSDVDAQQKMDRIEPSTGYYDIGRVAARLENEDAFGGLEFD